MSTMLRLPDRVVHLLRDGRGVLDHLRPKEEEDARLSDAARYWSVDTSESWRGNSHWREALDADTWQQIGRHHYDLVASWLRGLAGDRSDTSAEDAPALHAGSTLGRVVEWGAGGGANAVAFAPHASEFVAADISAPSLKECERQARAACDTPFRALLLDADRPEGAVAQIGAESSDLFLSFYVFEVLPSRSYALRVLRVAHDLLRPGGHAVIELKYQTSRIGTRSRRRSYVRNLAWMTTFEIHDFWERAIEVGFRPDLVHLVRRSPTGGERNAYFLLTKEAGNPS